MGQFSPAFVHCFEAPPRDSFPIRPGISFFSLFGVGIFAWRSWHMAGSTRQVWLLAGLTMFNLIMALGENGEPVSLAEEFCSVAGHRAVSVKYVFGGVRGSFAGNLCDSVY
jgi:hypothetical protein